jgi:hypothetical protein
MLRTIAAESAIFVLLNIFRISWLSFAAYPPGMTASLFQ